MIKQLKFQRLLAMIYIGAAIGIVHFRWQFFSGALFDSAELQALMSHFEGYYLWERSFVVPDCILAFGMLLASISLWTNRWMDKGRVLASACAGAALFLGILDLSYGFSSGLYVLKHGYAGVVLEAALSISAVGVVGLLILFFAPKIEVSEGS